MLVLSATPIPRTLVLTYFGDMDVPELREKPAGRQPIDTRAVPASRIDEVIEGVGRALKAGKLVYWICLAGRGTGGRRHRTSDQRHRTVREPATAVHDRVGPCPWADESGTEKIAMAQFAAHEIGLLVATTVVEVGVDVPAATIMVIENAERFGSRNCISCA